jgi:hypothetical protein
MLLCTRLARDVSCCELGHSEYRVRVAEKKAARAKVCLAVCGMIHMGLSFNEDLWLHPNALKLALLITSARSKVSLELNFV